MKNQTYTSHLVFLLKVKIMVRKTIEFNLNQQAQSLTVDPAMPLLWAIRELIGLTGTKFGCGKGLCGACTVHLNGMAIRACITPIEVVANQEITTIEGIQSEHPVKQAWKEQDVPQCGYCQPGQIMSAVALLKQNPKADLNQIKSGMAGNLCRCGTYQAILQAILQAQAMQATQFAQVKGNNHEA